MGVVLENFGVKVLHFIICETVGHIVIQIGFDVIQIEMSPLLKYMFIYIFDFVCSLDLFIREVINRVAYIAN